MAAALDQRFDGVVIGLVSDVDDPDGLGRVKVTLPWYASGYDEWARVAQLYAGSGYGSTWVPEVDTEVLVAFAHGDMRWPYVVGCLYSDVDTPPESRTASSDIKTLRTPAGSELAFDETNGTIDLKTPGGASIKLEEQAGAITLKSSTKIALDAPEITISGSSKVTIKGGSVAIN
jgi:phage baseplate assembly protein V